MDLGYEFYLCPVCHFKAQTTGDYIKHQRIHVGTYNFKFSCPLPTCHGSFESFRSVSAHISTHNIPRSEGAGCVQTAVHQCSLCDVKTPTLSALCKHVIEHSKSAQQVFCPLPNCQRSTPFASVKSFRVHLSLYHPGWLQEYGTSASAVSPPEEEDQEMDVEVNVPSSDANDDVGLGICVEDAAEVCQDANSDNDDSDDFEPFPSSDEGLYSNEDIVAYIANIYAMLEGQLLVPEQTVDKLAERLAFISEILQVRLKTQLQQVLQTHGVHEHVISIATTSVLSSDPFYNAHHKNAAGDALTTKHSRKEYYKKHFKYVEPVEINLKKNAMDREDVFQSVSIRENLTCILEDPSVQKEVDQSFKINVPDSRVLSDYKTGSVFCNGNNPEKRIDLLMFMDAFTVVNPLGSAKEDPKYKINGLYMTLGNLRPHLRSSLKSMQLVLLFPDNLLKGVDRHSEQRFKKVFKKPMRELRDLEQHGIEYKGEVLQVRLQFFHGDNLGQHTIGGFLESFSATYFCRYCDITKEQFKNDWSQDDPVFTGGVWRDHEAYTNALVKVAEEGLESYHGIKRNCPFNKLENFKVCDPRLPPCIAHDLFVGGVVELDLAAMIRDFVSKRWVTYSDLRNRIKRFKYVLNDRRNKPSFIKDNGLKLGGHAVQNWTLLRLLPYLIGSKIEPNNETWQLYLLLKRICEFVCAPALSTEQVEQLRLLQQEYLKKRKILGIACKPKYHYFWHYPDLFLKFGALIFHWTLAFEHRHQYFKKVVRSCGNFINVTYTMAQKFQVLQAYQSLGVLFPSDPVCKNAFPLVPATYKDDLQQFIRECELSDSALDVQCLIINEIIYKKEQWLLLKKASNNDDIVVAQIDLLICEAGECKAVVTEHRAKLWSEFGIYEINMSDPVRRLICLDTSLESPCPHAIYTFRDKLTFSLKNVLLHMT